MDTTKRVSIALCTYNGERFLREQLDSLLAQTYPIFEIVAQDDGSTDRTMDILSEYAAANPTIKVYCNEAAHGVNGNFYSCISRCKGDLIAICDQDDIWDKRKIEKLVAAIGDKMLCTCRSRQFSADGSYVHFDPREPNYSLLRMLYCTEISGHNILFKREMAGMTGLARDFQLYDTFFAMTAAAYESIASVNEVLVGWRRYTTAATYNDAAKVATPSAGNAWRMLSWSARHFFTIRRIAAPRYHDRQLWLQSLPIQSPLIADAIKMMRLQQHSGPISTLKLLGLCLRHRNEILHLKRYSPLMTLLRAVLFPLTSCYYDRNKI